MKIKTEKGDLKISLEKVEVDNAVIIKADRWIIGRITEEGILRLAKNINDPRIKTIKNGRIQLRRRT